MQLLVEHFREVWLIDFEYLSRPGDRPVPVCMVAWELRADRYLRLWKDQFRRRPPFGTDRDTLFVSYSAPAEIGCFLALGWPVPVRILDLFTEFRVATNGAKVVANNRLLTALTYYGLDGIGAEEKQEMIDLILSGGPWSREEIRAILELLPNRCGRFAQTVTRHASPDRPAACALSRTVYGGCGGDGICGRAG